MNGRPQPNEAAPYYFTYIDQVPGENALAVIESQLDECLQLLSKISEDKSLHRYAVEKWSIRQVLNHLSDLNAHSHFVLSGLRAASTLLYLVTINIYRERFSKQS
jgi:hypothetical protein